MDMVERYLQSKASRPTEAREIPNNAVNFFDQNSEFQKNFTPNEKMTSNEDTTFTAEALGYYTTELKNMVTPQGFNPIEQGVGLSRWTPDNKYYTPGQPSREGKN